MNQHLQNILNTIQQDKNLSEEEKNAIIKSLKDADKEFEITNFKLDRTEKVKRTTAILLEETIEELEHKRKAVEAQNRELEIESSLERVRTVAMSMNHRDDMLQVCRTISEQLEILNVKEIRNVQTAIFYEEKGTYMNYEYYAKHDKTFITETNYTNHEIARTFAEKMRKGKGEVSVTLIQGEEKVKEWLDYQKGTNVFIDTFLETAASLNYYWFSLGPLALGISTYVALNDVELNLFKRFINVFELAYRRYLDIEKAAAQAKEAQLETSLERVRAEAMAMRAPNDLLDICEVLFAELKTLGFEELRNTMINIHNDEKRSFLNYDYSDNAGKTVTNLFYDTHPVIEKQVKQAMSAPDAFSEAIYKGKDLEDWKAFRKKSGEADDPRVDNVEALYYYFYSIGNGVIGISVFNSITEEKLKVLKRFRNVFNLSYQRYTDIALAEAQAKEARIETALERVRAVAMAMTRSEELVSVCEVMYNELTSLSFDNLRNAQIAIENTERESYTFYIHSAFESVSGNEAKIDSSPIIQGLYQNLGKTKGFYEKEYSKTEMAAWRKWRKSISPLNDPREETVDSMCWYLYAIGKGHIGISTFNALTAEQIEIVKRFKTVFELSYKRFDDLQKAEAQTRESQIQLALERVRARTMAMQHSNELPDAANLLFLQVQSLGMPAWSAGYCTWNEDKSAVTAWMSSEAVLQPPFTAPTTEDELFIQMRKGQEEGKAFHVVEMGGDELVKHYQYMRTLPVMDKILDSIIDAGYPLPTFQIMHHAYFSKGFLLFITYEPVPAAHDIFQRFAKVFDQTYTRFLDLQKAEAQAREAQIEVAVERVRAQSMAMHQTTDLDKVNKELYNQLKFLNVYGLSGVSMYFFDEEGEIKVWDLSSPGNIGDPNSYTIKFSSKKYPVLGELWEHYKNSGDYFTEDYPLEKLKKAAGEFRDIDINMANAIEQAIKNGSLKHQWNAFGKIANGLLGVDLIAPASEDTKTIVIKMAGAFNLAYKRFLDLQKAEAQTKEAKIEAALERTRTQSMIMQHSNELDDTLRVFHEQVLLLNIPSVFSFLWLPDEEKDKHIFWAAWAENGSPTQLVDPKSIVFRSKSINYPLDRNEPATAQCLVDWKGTEPIVSYHVPPAGVANYFAAWQELIDGVEQLKPEHFSGGLYYVEAFMKYGCFGVMVTNDLNEDEKKILGRFAIEFERTYRRFLDLQKAEAQAREAQIETALEKVRSRTMAMQKSDELPGTAALLFEEFKKLEQQELIQTTIGIYNEAKNEIEFRATNWQGGGEQVIRPSYGSMDEPTLLKPAVTAWRAKEKSLVVDLTGEELEGWVKYRNKMTDVTISSKDAGGRRVVSIAFFSKGHLSLSSPLPLPAEAVKTLERFAAVFDGTYTRFLDLLKAEAQAKESQIEVALERVRSRTLAMQRSDELAETAAVLFKQLILLGIQPNRLYIAIVKDETGNTEFWITDEDGTKVSSAFETNLNDNPTFKKMFDGWKAQKRTLVMDMEGKELQEYFKYLTSIHVPFKGGLSQKRRIQDIAYFSNGFIGMASPDEQPAETLQLLERFAYVFNLTFTRFNDLQLAEAHAIQAEQDLIAIKEAKQKAEETLTELQATQKQLIQSEKMASLGELTAGIAHEIQNPLNFVNNFSEVSTELLQEMMNEVEKGNTEEAKFIADDLVQNLQKINHHGKRADAIVKGMLQHSRTTSSTKESTDVNKLVDEYLRLAYHGLRAKDKSFNATLKTDFDNSIDNINIIPQDIGRVVLNLITNAFYSVGEKKKQINNNYEPTVSVSTKSTSPPLGGRGVSIIVSDNGTGIPQNILDKIFHPFFTTKPTGQGTGLGLSLAYDIVKAHGGELKVETKEGEGSEFIIQLPGG